MYFQDNYLLRVVITSDSVGNKKRASSSSNSEERKDKSYNDYQDAIKDIQCFWITKLGNAKKLISISTLSFEHLLLKGNWLIFMMKKLLYFFQKKVKI